MRIVPEKHQAEDDLLKGFAAAAGRFAKGLFTPLAPITAARAPGRLDAMGGIADYSGSVVFQMPLDRAAVVAFQPRSDDTFVVRTTGLGPRGSTVEVRATAEELRSVATASAALSAAGDRSWAAYLLGLVPVLRREGVHDFQRGGAFFVHSDVPIGMGVSSSAALEVAALHAVNCHLDLGIEPLRMARLCQMVENEVAGAPCGIMDQVAAACGRAGQVLAIRCRPTPEMPEIPCEILGHHALPQGVRLFGLTSRVEHRVSGSAYQRARVSAFMGLRIINRALESQGSGIDCLCALQPAVYFRRWRERLPEAITGRDFVQRYGQTADPATCVDPRATYRVRAGTDHPVLENQRVRRFIQSIDRAASGDRTALVEAGGLMYAAHHSYSWNCRLACPETDLLVELVRRRGPAQGLYGARVTGGGSGGTVAILAAADASGALRDIAGEYADRTGLQPDIFDRSGPGACAFGLRRYRLDEDTDG